MRLLMLIILLSVLDHPVDVNIRNSQTRRNNCRKKLSAKVSSDEWTSGHGDWQFSSFSVMSPVKRSEWVIDLNGGGGFYRS